MDCDNLLYINKADQKEFRQSWHSFWKNIEIVKTRWPEIAAKWSASMMQSHVARKMGLIHERQN